MENHLLLHLPDTIIHIIYRMLEKNPNHRILIGPLTKVLSDVVHNDILNADPAYLIKYLKHDGQPEDPFDYM